MLAQEEDQRPPLRLCKVCGTANPNTHTHCTACEADLETGEEVRTRRIGSGFLHRYFDVANRRSTRPLDEVTLLRLHLEGTYHPYQIYISEGTRLLIGRQDSEHDIFPDVDLGPHHGFERGVSRSHAVLQVHNNQLMIHDLGTPNGTFVNEERLFPNLPCILSNDDWLRLGMFGLRVEF